MIGNLKVFGSGRTLLVCSLAMGLLSGAFAQTASGSVQPGGVKTQAPAKLVAENSDRSAVNKSTQADLSRIVSAWIEADQKQDATAKTALKTELAALHVKDDKKARRR